MVLDDEQVNRFFDTMDALLYYVNERFRVVKGLSLESGSVIEDVKASMVARALWENPEIIEDFVRYNPYDLPKRCLDVAAGWRYALPGFYTLVRYQAGRALMMGDAGVFSVGGVTYELEGEIGPAPAGVEMVLLPFDDVIVYDGFLQAYDLDRSAAAHESKRIQDEFEQRCSAGIVSTASEFIDRARTFLAAKREQEFDSLLADAAFGSDDDVKEAPKGFHRGALAGLTGFERDLALQEYIANMASDKSGVVQHDGDGDKGADSNASDKSGIVQHDDGEGEGADRNDSGEAPAQQVLEGGLVVNGRLWREALKCANACVVLYGVVSVSDAYAQYRSLCFEALDENQFHKVLELESGYLGEAVFEFWRYNNTEYLVHYTLGPDYVAREFMRAHARVAHGVFRNPETGEISIPSVSALAQGADSDLIIELGELEQYKRDLTSVRSELRLKPLSRSVLEQDVIAGLLADQTVIALRDFLDERIPDGENDYTFADRVCEEIVFLSIESGSLEELFSYVAGLGLSNCCADESRLPLLITNVFNAMPSWENNGWSPQELYEQMTGRRLFYNADGTVKRMGPDDPCPCGSGRKYGDCCGR